MDLASIRLEPLLKRTVAVLGYGNQGRAQALCLRDSGVSVIVGLRPDGTSAEVARREGFEVQSFEAAAEKGDVVLFLLPDHIIPEVYRSVRSVLESRSRILGFAHGFAVLYRWVDLGADARAFIVSPKGAGAILRSRFLEGGGLPGAFAVSSKEDPELREIALAYAKAIGCASWVLIETSFREETESDLFGEQVVLCGGIMELMKVAFDTLVQRGHSPEMAFFECCYEARLITELWMRFGPEGMSRQISPTAFFGGVTRGKRLVTDETRREIEKIFDEIRSGRFAEEWAEEITQGFPKSKHAREELAQSELNRVYRELKPQLD